MKTSVLMTLPFLSSFWKQNHKAEEILLGIPSFRSFLSPSTFPLLFKLSNSALPISILEFVCVCACRCVHLPWHTNGGQKGIYCAGSRLPSCLRLNIFLLPLCMPFQAFSCLSFHLTMELCIWFYLWSLEFKFRSSHLCGKFFSHLTIFPGPPLVFQMRCYT